MGDDPKADRLESIRADLQRGLEFHATSFSEIDEKAKYWLTVTIPSLLALAGYGFQSGQTLSSYLVAMICAVCVCLFAATYFLANSIGSRQVSGGIPIPADQKFDSLKYYIESDENWSQYEDARARTILSALLANESQNSRKGSNLRIAELLLFRGVPAVAVAAAVCAALLDTSVAQRGWTGTPAGTTTGIAIGAAAAAALWAVGHFCPLKR